MEEKHTDDPATVEEVINRMDKRTQEFRQLLDQFHDKKILTFELICAVSAIGYYDGLRASRELPQAK